MPRSNAYSSRRSVLRRRWSLERLETRLTLSADDLAPDDFKDDADHLMAATIAPSDDTAAQLLIAGDPRAANTAPIAMDSVHSVNGADQNQPETSLPYPQLADADRLLGELPHFFVGNHAGGGDWIPDVAAQPTFVAPQGTTRWSQWASQLKDGDIVLIPSGAHVIYDANSPTILKAIGVAGTLEFDASQSTSLRVGTILVYPTGHFLIGERELDDGARTLVAAERAAGVLTTIDFVGRVNLTEDPGQMTIGLLAAGGVVHVRGAEVVDPYARLAARAEAGASELVFSAPVAWQAGDYIILADTQVGAIVGQATLQNETVAVLAVDGNVVTLVKPLAYAHEGYVARLGRSVVLQSNEMATGEVVGAPADAMSRAHMLFTGDADVVIQGAALVDLGRTMAAALDDTPRDAQGRVQLNADGTPDYGTNQRGRYPLHAHHLEKSFLFADNLIDGGLKWGITIHQTDGVIRQNVVLHVDGAGIAAENGTETGLVEGNLVIGDGRGSGVLDVTIVNARPAERAADSFGHGGYGYWFASPLMTVRDNIAAGQFRIEAFNYFLFGKAGLKVNEVEGRNPEYVEGINPSVLAGQAFNPTNQPILKFTGNVADLALGDGFVSYYSNAGNWAVDNFTAYIRGARNRGVVLYYSAPPLQPREAFQGVTNSTILGPYSLGLDPTKAPARPNPRLLMLSIGIDGNQQGATPTMRVTNTRVEGFYNGILVPKGGGDLTRLELNNFRDIWVPWSVFPASQVNIRDVMHGSLAPSTQAHENIYLQDDVTPLVAAVRNSNIVARLVSWLNSRTDVRVYNYNGTGRDFQLWFEPQRPDFVIPILELTNAEAWKRYGLAIGGAIAPAGSEAGVVGAYSGTIAAPRPAIWTVTSPIVTAPSAFVEYRIKFSTFEQAPAAGVVRTTFSGLQPGLNLIPVKVNYLGAAYTKTLVLWGKFTVETP
ncbi:MAG: G8 domain-containing protein [Pirellulales bacterium]|nr:G8 domain-containing protein [Pirellulales bacterium]